MGEVEAAAVLLQELELADRTQNGGAHQHPHDEVPVEEVVVSIQLQ